MTQDEIISMAKEAGMEVHERKGQIRIGSAVLTGCDSTAQLERFAALVEAKAAAKEREACAQVCDEMHTHYSDYKDTALLNGDVELSNAASGEPRACEAIAKIIRARGTT